MLALVLTILTIGSLVRCRCLLQPRVNNALAFNANASVHYNNTPPGYQPDHPDWFYLNDKPWFILDPTQQDHMRFHAYLSMSAYGDFRTLCPRTFLKGFTVLQEFNATRQAGYIALVPEMNKVVVVFRGVSDDYLKNWAPVSIEDLVPECPGCTVASAVKSLYLDARTATNDFEVARRYVDKNPSIKFSTTGHGISGLVAALTAMNLAPRNYVHYSHNQGTPRGFNYAAVVKYDNMFQVLAGQSLVSVNDYMLQAVPLGTFSHIGQKVKILGPMQQYLVNCWGNNEDTTCVGSGTDTKIHNLYFTPAGTCGKVDKGW